MTPLLLTILVTTSSVSESELASLKAREANYRRAAILNAEAADKCLIQLDSARELAIADGRLRELSVIPLEPLPQAEPAESPLHPILYGIAGLGVGLAVGAFITLAAVE